MKKYKLFLLTTALIITLLIAGCNTSLADDQLTSVDELTVKPQGYLIRDLIPAIPGEYKRVFNSRTLSGYQPQTSGKQVNILLLGLDTRGLSDALLLVSYNPETFTGSLVTIKRDTFIAFQTWSEHDMGHNAIGWANYAGMGYGGSDYHSGAKYTATVVEQLLGIEINAYASITFDGFVELIDQIGGVVVNVAPKFAERSSGPLTPGTRRLFGEEALIFARHRMNPRIPEPGSISEDGDRVRRHHTLLKAVLEQCKTLSTEELLATYNNLDQLIYTNMDDWNFLTLANILFNHDPRQIEQVVLPGELRIVYEDKIETEIEYYYLDLVETDKILTDLGLK